MRILALLMLAVCLNFMATAQDKKEAKKVEATSPSPSVGKEVGAAVNQIMTALVTDGNKLAKSEVGLFTIFLVAWKVMGRTLVRFAIGFPLLWVLIWIWWRSYQRTSLTRISMTAETESTRKYQLVQPNEGRAMAHGFSLCIILVGSYILMFA